MSEYKFYQNSVFEKIDAPIEIDLRSDIGRDRIDVQIFCDSSSIIVEIDFCGTYGDKITMLQGEKLKIARVRKIRLTSNGDLAAYRVIGGLKG